MTSVVYHGHKALNQIKSKYGYPRAVQDQTAPIGAVGSEPSLATVCNSFCIIMKHFSVNKKKSGICRKS